MPMMASLVALVFLTSFLTSVTAFPVPDRPAPRGFSQLHVSKRDSNSPSPFDPLKHLAGISPYFNSVTKNISTDSPDGCTITKAAFLIRHTSIYGNDFDYEETILPFLSKLSNYTGTFNAPLEFLNNYTDPVTNAEEEIEKVTPKGLSDAQGLGETFAKYFSHLLPNSSDVQRDKLKVYTASASRDTSTTSAFLTGLYGSPETVNASSQTVEVTESKTAGSNSLTPHKSCGLFDAAAGSEQSESWMDIYTQAPRTRLDKSGAGFNFSADDVKAMMQLCGYDTVIRNQTSPFCSLSVFSEEEWLGFEYASDLMYHYSLGYGQPLAGVLGYPYLAATTSELLSSNSTPQSLYLSFTHREEPAFLAVALGIFNNSAYGTDTRGVNGSMPSGELNRDRAWKTSHIIPFLGHIGMEVLSCSTSSSSSLSASAQEQFVRITTNSAPIPLPTCQSGPGASCPAAEFQAYVEERGTGELQFGGEGRFNTMCGMDEETVASARTVGGGDGHLQIYQGVVPPLDEEDGGDK